MKVFTNPQRNFRSMLSRLTKSLPVTRIRAGVKGGLHDPSQQQSYRYSFYGERQRFQNRLFAYCPRSDLRRGRNQSGFSLTSLPSMKGGANDEVIVWF